MEGHCIYFESVFLSSFITFCFSYKLILKEKKNLRKCKFLQNTFVPRSRSSFMRVRLIKVEQSFNKR